MDHVHVEAKRGAAFELPAGESVEITDTEGGQAIDVTAFPAADPEEAFSAKYTYRRTGKVRLETGDSMYTTAGDPIATLVADDCGVNDLLLGPCNEWIVSEYYGQEDEIGCRGNLQAVLEPLGVDPARIQEVLNLFTRVTVTDHTYIDFREPPSEPGDTAELRAERDALVGVAPCTGDSVLSEGGPTPIDLRVPDGVEVTTNF
ncbi:urea carboxylase-associated family protein [Natronomonas sp.]|uniref:urea carboxylase-associated family protein n=1 Tax=Natronomonas sp. TaxID=2184060 RepID=UPI002624366F|nr:urea carboxylase-associated family protein [Natronomonas sp.]